MTVCPTSGKKMAMIIRKKKILFIILTCSFATVLLSSNCVIIETAIGIMATLNRRLIIVERCSLSIWIIPYKKVTPSTDFLRASKSGTSFFERMTGVTRIMQTTNKMARRIQDFIYEI